MTHQTLGKLYLIAKGLGETTKDKCNLIEKILGYHWFTTEFSKDKLRVIIREWCNSLAIDPYLSSMDLFFENKLVYRADVHELEVSLQKPHIVKKSNDWMDYVNKFVSEYKICS